LNSFEPWAGLVMAVVTGGVTFALSQWFAQIASVQ
jgi:hypothetical protein